MKLGEAQAPAGMRLYAIGDIHGLDAALAGMHERIASDLAARPVRDHRIIHVGDYVDRGPDSAAVIRRLAAMTAASPNVVCLRGNHDQMMLDFLADPEKAGSMFLANGGKATLRSFGINLRARNYSTLGQSLTDVMTENERAFLDGLSFSARFGDFLFVHAGIRPGVPLDQQTPDDMIWIREAFLGEDRDHGVVVIHGHTPVPAPEVKPNRIDIDTGAVYGGVLTCLAIEGRDYRFL